MGYAYESYRRLPQLTDHAKAKKRLESTKPIRATTKGPSYVRYPLSSSRRDTHFLIRRAGDEASKPDGFNAKDAPNTGEGDIQLMLYGSALITLHEQPESDPPEFTICCSNYGRWSSADCAFIGSILWKYFQGVVTNRGRLVLTDRYGEKFVVERGGSVRLKYEQRLDIQKLVAMTPTQNTTLRLNRTATNIVRARYGKFYRYMKGMIGVRKEVMSSKWHDWKTGEDVITEESIVRFSDAEIAEALPTTETMVDSDPVWVADDFRFYSPLNKPPKVCIVDQYEDGVWKVKEDLAPYAKWQANTENFLALVTAPDDDPEQHEKFRIAFVQVGWFAHPQVKPRDFQTGVDTFGKIMDEIIFKYHSEEVFDRVPVKQGQLPNIKYESWLTRERGRR